MRSRYQVTRKWLIFWCMFIGIGAVAGSAAMIAVPDGSVLGMSGMLPYFQVLPFADILFQNLLFAGIALLIVNGITNLTAAALLLSGKKAGIILGGVFGVTLMLWICIQFYMFPANFMSITYFIFGLLQAVTGFAAYVFFRQEAFAQTEQERLQKQNTEDLRTELSDTLIVYFSRMGYVRHYAYELKQKYNADIYEVKSTERTEGTLGFWWCGRFGMHRWQMPIEPISVDLEKYDKVIICTPIWVFGLSAPMRSFCVQASGKIKNTEYVLVHFQKSRYGNVCGEMDELLGSRHQKACSICARQGKEIARYEL